MKKIMFHFLIFGLLLIVSSGAYCQNGQGKGRGQGKPDKANKEIPTPAQRAEKFSERLKVDAEISDEQSVKIRQAQENFLIQRAEILKKYNGDRKAAQAELKPIKQQRQQAIKEILTPEQREKLKAAMQARKAQKGKTPNAPKGKKGKSEIPSAAEEDEDDDDTDGL